MRTQCWAFHLGLSVWDKTAPWKVSWSNGWDGCVSKQPQGANGTGYDRVMKKSCKITNGVPDFEKFVKYFMKKVIFKQGPEGWVGVWQVREKGGVSKVLIAQFLWD